MAATLKRRGKEKSYAARNTSALRSATLGGGGVLENKETQSVRESMLRTDGSKKGYAFVSNPERQADVGAL